MTITAGLDTYLSLADADAYFSARNVAGWAAAPTVAREAALLQATAFLDGRYAFAGVLADAGQPLAWPRRGAYDREGRPLEGIPRRVEHACAELALIALSGDLAPPEPRGGLVRSEQIGPVSISYQDGAPPGPGYPYVDLLLSGLLEPRRGARVSRS